MTDDRAAVPVVRLGEVAKIVSGGTPSRTNPAFWGGDIPWVKTANIRNGRIGLADVDERITEAGLRGSSARVIPADTILMAMYGQGGTRGRVSILGIDAAVNQACAAILLTECADTDYVFQVLRHHYQSIRGMSNTGSQENLSAELLRAIPLPLPVLAEQRRIAADLGVCDAAVEKCQSLLRAKRRRLEWLRRTTMDSACDGWPHVRFGDAFKVVSERLRPGDDLLAVTQDRGVVPRSTLDRRIGASASSTANYKRISRGDFAVSLRSFEGGIEYCGYLGGISAAYTVLRPQPSVDSRFYQAFFKSDIFIRRYLAESVVGIRDGKQIDMAGMMMTRIPLPSLDEQLSAARVLETADRETVLQARHVEALRCEIAALRGSLL